MNLGSEAAAVAAAAAVICCRLSISCSGWFDGSEADDEEAAAVAVATDPQFEIDPQWEKKDIWWAAQGIFSCFWLARTILTSY